MWVIEVTYRTCGFPGFRTFVFTTKGNHRRPNEVLRNGACFLVWTGVGSFGYVTVRKAGKQVDEVTVAEIPFLQMKVPPTGAAETTKKGEHQTVELL